MLTRYLYDCDEVCYALIDALYKRRPKEAVFWARELVLSKELDILDRTVVRAWLMFLGASHINWLDAWFSGRDLRLIEEFPSLIKKGRTALGLKTFIMVARGFSLEQDLDKVSLALEENDPFSFYRWSAFEKAPSALFEFVKERVDEPSLFDSIGKALDLFSVLSMKSLLTAAAVQLLCLRSYRDNYVISSESKGLGLLEMYDGLKQNRAYKIVGSMLPCRHKRNTQWEVLCKSHREIIMGAGSRFWSDVAARISDDDVFETVSEELFPEDCPDEWSIADRAVSHPDKFVKYKQHIRPTYRCKLLWGFVPALRVEWFDALNTLFKACLAPEN
jgi:hypothetical protein